jgi:hypothetical protein
MPNCSSGKNDVGKQAMPGLDARERIEEQGAGQVENDPGAAPLPAPDHVGMDASDGDIGADEDGLDIALDAGDVYYGNTIVGVMTIAVQWVEAVGEEAEVELNDGAGEQMERMFDAVAIAVTRVIICSGDDIDDGEFEGLDHLGFGPKNHTVIPRAAADGERRYETDVGDIGRGEHRRKFP